VYLPKSTCRFNLRNAVQQRTALSIRAIDTLQVAECLKIYRKVAPVLLKLSSLLQILGENCKAVKILSENFHIFLQSSFPALHTLNWIFFPRQIVALKKDGY
jgi:hypothetical protein